MRISPMSTTALSRAEPEAVGLSSLRLRRIGEALRREVDAQQLPGAVVGAARRPARALRGGRSA